MSRLAAEHTLASGQIVRLIHGDLTDEQVDAIVNAANAQLAHGGGVAGAIVRRGGAVIQDESTAWVREHGPVTHGHPAITGAGRLPCRFVIHAVGPVWGEGDEDAKLSAAVAGALTLASERGLETVALPAISTGIFGFPKGRAATILLAAVEGYAANHPDARVREIRIVIIDEPTVDAFCEAFDSRWPGSAQDREP
jgi:O-acetyl-ADP-ribose deacetylase (regulator of RNase III)